MRYTETRGRRGPCDLLADVQSPVSPGEFCIMPSASELVQSCTSVFTLPEIYSRVRDVVDDSNSTMEDLVKVFQLDPAISARLLRIANSPQYGAPKQIDTITRAINLIGVQAVKDLLTATTVGRTFSGMRVHLNAGSSHGCTQVLAQERILRVGRRKDGEVVWHRRQ